MTVSRLRLWVPAALVAFAVLGPALTGGPFVTLDLVVFDAVDVPEGWWGLGTELPRALPLWVVLGLVDPLVGALLGIALVGAFAGAARLARLAGAGAPTQALAGALYTLSPFLLTRLGAGHVGVVLVLAVLPWAAIPLLDPAHSGARTFLWSAALAGAGLVGGLYGGVLVAVGWWRDGRRRPLAVWGSFLLAQLPWLVPALVAWTTSPPAPVGAATFGTELEPVVGPLQLAAGDGFWRESSQVGGSGTLTAVAGAGLLLLAALGVRRLPAWRAGVAVAAVGFGVALVSWVPGLSSLHEAVAETPLGAPFRESQRLLGLFVVWMAPAAALGVRSLAKKARRPWERAAPVAAAGALVALLGLPGLGAVDGRLEPVGAPGSWAVAAEAIEEAGGGTVVALPWHRYLDVSFAGGRRALHPLPPYLGGDVVTSSDPELGEPAREALDPREPFLATVVERIEEGRDVGADLARAGVRFVALAHEADWRRWAPGLAAMGSLEHVVRGEDIDLYEVRAWEGTEPDRPLPPVASFPDGADVVWHHPWARGWVGGERTAEGLVRVPGGGTVWFWPAALVVAGHAATFAALVGAVVRVRRRPTP